MWIASIEAEGIKVREHLIHYGHRGLWKDLVGEINNRLFNELADIESRVEKLKVDLEAIGKETGWFIPQVNCFVPGFDKFKQPVSEDDIWYFVEGFLIVKFKKVNLGHNDPQAGWQRKAVAKVMGES
ncbi:hypothetical protein [Lacihabitans soyangensis]|uniref:Uncharacterized protein n=1 Tax=Lacihabitans soyangensis TaxID=869394 RepID=A0AAE3H684_9BACT|nr:hypothetical protein [Lacihabitans soyangensis]MCP9764945.1 hypothetical protein [Lacihabitans soyangensis]